MLKNPRLGRPARRISVTETQARRYRVKPLLPVEAPIADTYRQDCWLEIPIENGWVAAYRLAHSGPKQARRTSILDVRIFPDEPDRPLGEWSGDVLGSDAQLADHHFSFDRVQRALREKVFNAALSATTTVAADADMLDALGNPSGRASVSEEEGRGAGRPGLPLSFYARVAVRYDEIEHDFRREPRTSTREQIRTEFGGETVAAVGRWLTKAEALGYLTRVAAGSRGRRATEKARSFAAQARKRKKEN